MSDEPVDMAVLAELRDIMAEDFPVLIETFITDSQMRVEAIKNALASGVGEEIRRAAHSFKGSASNLGATRLTVLCQELETAGHENRVDDLDNLFVEIKDEFDKVQQIMNALE